MWNPKESKGRLTTTIYLPFLHVNPSCRSLAALGRAYRAVVTDRRGASSLTGEWICLLTAIGRVRAGEFVGEFRAFQVRVVEGHFSQRGGGKAPPQPFKPHPTPFASSGPVSHRAIELTPSHHCLPQPYSTQACEISFGEMRLAQVIARYLPPARS